MSGVDELDAFKDGGDCAIFGDEVIEDTMILK